MRALRALRLWSVLGATLLMTCVPQPQTAPAPEIIQAGQPAVTGTIPEVVRLADSTLILRFDPPPAYLIWYAQILECTGQDPDKLPTFWVASRINFPDRHNAWAFYQHETQRIVFGLGSETVDWIVRHEMTHHAIRPLIPPPSENETWDEAQRRTHPVEFFGATAPDGTTVAGKCSALVRPIPRPVVPPPAVRPTSPTQWRRT